MMGHYSSNTGKLQVIKRGLMLAMVVVSLCITIAGVISYWHILGWVYMRPPAYLPGNIDPECLVPLDITEKDMVANWARGTLMFVDEQTSRLPYVTLGLSDGIFLLGTAFPAGSVRDFAVDLDCQTPRLRLYSEVCSYSTPAIRCLGIRVPWWLMVLFPAIVPIYAFFIGPIICKYRQRRHGDMVVE